MTKNKQLSRFNSPVLASIITRAEAMLFWDKTFRQVDYAIWRGDIVARLTVTGGNWLIEYESCVKLWGSPQVDNIGNYIAFEGES